MSLDQAFGAVCNVAVCADGDAELIEKGKALLGDVAYTYIAKRTESMDTLDEIPEIRFYYEGVEVYCAVHTSTFISPLQQQNHTRKLKYNKLTYTIHPVMQKNEKRTYLASARRMHNVCLL